MSSYPKGPPLRELPPNVESVDTTHVTSAIPLQQRQAADTNFLNCQNVFKDALAAVRVCEPKRDTSQNQRLRYELNWQKLRSAAENYTPLANARGIKVMVPTYFPPPATAEQWHEYVPAPVSDGKYRETGGLGPSGKGIPPAIPGSAADSNWLER